MSRPRPFFLSLGSVHFSQGKFLSVSVLLGLLIALSAAVGSLRAAENSFLCTFFDARTTGGSEPFWSIAQDERGVLYFGCETLITFDGERWTRHSLDKTYEIRSVAVGLDGRVWIGAMNELGYCDRTLTGEIGAYHSLRSWLPDPTKNLGEVWSVLVRGKETVFVTQTLVLVWNGEKFSINELSGGRRLAALQVQDEIYITQRYRGVLRLAGQQLVPFLSPETLGATDMGIDGIATLQDGWLLVTTKGLIKTDAKHSEFIQSDASEFLVKNVPTGLCKLRDGRICVSTIGGVAMISPEGKLLETLDHVDRLGSLSAYAIFAARDESIWVATASGVVRLVANKSAQLFDSPKGLVGKPCNGIAELGSVIYVGTRLGLFAGDKSKSPLQFHRATEGQPPPCHDIAVANNRLYVGGYRGTYIYENSALRLMAPTKQDPVVVRQSISHETLFACDGLNLVRVPLETSLPPQPIARLPDSPLTITEEETGRIWLGTRANGVLQVLPNGDVTQFKSGGIRGDRCLTVRIADRLAICSSAGASLFQFGSTRDEPVYGVPQTTPLAASNEDSSRGAWIAYASPFASEPKMPLLGRLTVDEGGLGHWTQFAAEGLDRIGNINSLFVDSEGLVWISGTEGVLQLRPTALEGVFTPSAPIIVASVIPSADLEYASNAVVFHLASAEYGRRPALRFQTKIRGLSDQWSEPTNEARVQLTGLRDSSYELAARVVNDAGMTSAPTTWRFRVLPPWYRTKTAYGAWTALLAAAMFGLVQWRSSYLRQQNLRLEALVRKKTEQLEQANQAKTDFIADMSHEIRNPISGIVGLSLAMEETALDKRQRELTDSIRSCASLLATLVDDVLDFSKIEAGKIDLRLAPFDVRALLEQCTAMVAEDARRAGAKLNIEMEEGVPPRLVGDAARIQQIILNYLTNAVKFASAGAIVVGASRPSPERVRFYVRDQGPGMSATEAAQLFTKFARLEKARANNVRGSGLGLAVCRFLADKMGGSVGVNSEIGHGSCFWAELPLPVANEQPARPAAPAPSGPPLRALIVEDIDYNAAAMQAVLRKLGVQSDVVSDGPSALEQLQRTFYDIAFMDWNLPGMIGTEVVSRFRTVESPQRRTIIIATTAYSAEFNREACLKAGMDAFIGKPLTPEKIAAALRDLRGSLRSAISVEVSSQPLPPKTTPTSNGQLDLQMLRFLGDNTPEGLHVQITRYLASFEKDRDALNETSKTGDAQAIHRIAHRLASHASMVRYEPLRELAATLQSRSATSNRKELDELFAAFDREFETFRKKLDSIRSSTGSA